MNLPPRPILGLGGVQCLCFVFVFISLLSHAWIRVEDGNEAATYGIFSSCYMLEESTTWAGKEFETHCSHCLSTSDAQLTPGVSFSSLRAARAFAVLTLITVILFTAAVLMFLILVTCDVKLLPLEKVFWFLVVTGIIQWTLFLVTLICTSSFMNQLDHVNFSNGTSAEVGALDFGYGKVMSWITFFVLIVPVGLNGFMAYELVTGKASPMGT